MQAAEIRGKSIGCHAAWLDTSNPNAMTFYKKQGYEIFGQLENQAMQKPKKHKRWFMKKELSK